jgi:PST family polysaccharide transporter
MATLNFAKITILSGIVTFFRLLAGLLISKVVAIYTGPSGMASLGQLQNMVTFINGFVSSQVSQGINRYSSEYKDDYENAKYYWRAAIKLSVLACCFIICIGIILSTKVSQYLFHQDQYYWLVIVALCVLPLNIINNIFLGVLNGLGEHNRFFLANLLAIISALISMTALVYFFGITGALISAALNNAIAGLCLIALIFKRPWFKIKFWIGIASSKHTAEMRKYFYMGVIGALTGPISLIAVRTIISNDLTQDYAGYWQAVSKISEAYLAVLTTALTVYYFPKTAAAKTVEDYLSTLKSGAVVVIPLAFLFACAIFLCKDLIIKILFTAEFYRARDLFLFQNIGDFFRIASWLFATILLAKGYFKINAILEITFSLLFPLATKLLIPSLGLPGVSVAYFLTYFIYLLVTVFIYIQHLKRVKNATF